MDKKGFIIISIMALAFFTVWYGLAGIVDATNSPILHRFGTISTIALTLPANGDVNPYNVMRVKQSIGNLKAGHILVSNFNKPGNPGSTDPMILDVGPDGTFNVFSRLRADELPALCPGGMGLTTGLAVLREGWVIVGVLPVAAGPRDFSPSGCLIVLDSTGKPVETFSGSLINGPRDIVAYENGYQAKLFVTNVLNGTVSADGQIVNEGNVVRINLNTAGERAPRVESMTVVASGFPQRTDPDAIVLGPTGLRLAPKCGRSDEDDCPDYSEESGHLLYLADTLNNRIAVIENALNRATSAGLGRTLSTGGSLNNPLGLVIASNGNILSVNGNNDVITEITPLGQQIASASAGQYRHKAWSAGGGLH